MKPLWAGLVGETTLISRLCPRGKNKSVCERAKGPGYGKGPSEVNLQGENGVIIPPQFFILFGLSNEVLRWALSFPELNNQSEDATNMPRKEKIKLSGDRQCKEGSKAEPSESITGCSPTWTTTRSFITIADVSSSLLGGERVQAQNSAKWINKADCTHVDSFYACVYELEWLCNKPWIVDSDYIKMDYVHISTNWGRGLIIH